MARASAGEIRCSSTAQRVARRIKALTVEDLSHEPPDAPLPRGLVR
jgi:hypothetical protein